MWSGTDKNLFWDGWNKHGETLLRIAVVLMAIAAVVWLGYEFGRLLFDLKVRHHGAIDLELRQQEVQTWFRGEPVYGSLGMAVYPPASYAILWPLVGWLDFSASRWLYAFTVAGSLVWLVRLLVTVSGASSRLERVLVGLIPLSVYASGATIGNGQIIVYVMPALISGLLLFSRGSSGWVQDVVGSFLVAVALVKPSVTAPFLWMVLFAPARLRPALLTGFIYLGFSALALCFQHGELFSLFEAFRKGTAEVLSHDAVKYSHTNVHSWLSFLGLAAWIPAASLALFSGLGVWIFLHRRFGVWLLAGVTALVARFWTFHGWYDDLLLVVPLISLFRVAKSGASRGGSGGVAGVLFAVTLLTLMAPGGLYLLPRPWNQFYVAGQTVVWLAVLVFLLVHAERPLFAGPSDDALQEVFKQSPVERPVVDDAGNGTSRVKTQQ